MDWNAYTYFSNESYTVAPLVGAWIEISTVTGDVVGTIVAPLVGAWIEIFHSATPAGWDFVAPLVGAWIEIAWLVTGSYDGRSLLSWERGLK